MAEGTPKDFVVKNGLVVNSSLIYATGGKVGVNTASPIAALDVTGNFNVNKVVGAKLGFNVTDTFTPSGGVNTAINYGLSTGATAADRVELSGYSGLSLFTTALERMRIDAGGNVGISNNNPNAKLQVTGTANVDGVFKVSGNITATGTFVNVTGTFQGTKTDIGNTVITGTANVTGNVLASGTFVNVTGTFQSGNAALGNTTITGIANISGNVVISSYLSVGNTSTNTVLGYNSTNKTMAEFAGNANGFNYILIRNSNTGIDSSADISVYNDSWETTQDKFIDFGILSSTYSNSSWTISPANSGYLYTGNSTLSIGADGSNYVNFFTGSSLIANERMRIDAGGNVGISNSNPNAKLQVTGTANIDGVFRLSGNATLSGSFTNVTTTFQAGKTDIGNTVITGTANVTGNVLISGTFVNVTGALQTGIAILGNTTLNGFANVVTTFQAGKTDIGNTLITGTANVTGNVLASGSFVNVTGTFQSGSTILGNTSFNGGELNNFKANVQIKTANYTLTNADSGSIVEINSAANVTVTLPNTSPVGFNLSVTRIGGGNVTFSNSTGSTLKKRSTGANLAGQYAVASVYVRTNSSGGAADWVLAGDLI